MSVAAEEEPLKSWLRLRPTEKLMASIFRKRASPQRRRQTNDGFKLEASKFNTVPYRTYPSSMKRSTLSQQLKHISSGRTWTATCVKSCEFSNRAAHLLSLPKSTRAEKQWRASLPKNMSR